MQSFNFVLRQSTAESVDDNRSRYVPSSIYSGPGPAEESSVPPHPIYATNGYGRVSLSNGSRQSNGPDGLTSNGGPRRSTRFGSYIQPLNEKRPRISTALNLSDPVLMHLLAETALSDSREFEIVSFEELEQLKRDRLVLRNRVEATKRKIALECKLRDAAQSLNRLYTKTQGSSDNSHIDAKSHTRNGAGSKNSNNEALSRANDEYEASCRKIEDLTYDLKMLETRSEDTQRRIMEHTAGILQLTHRGLKKNSKRNDLPRSPVSIVSPGYEGVSEQEQMDDFDERSLYPVPDYVHEFSLSNPVTPILASNSASKGDTQAWQNFTTSLLELSGRLHTMIQQTNPGENLLSPPAFAEPTEGPQKDSQAHKQIDYISEGLDALNAIQQRTMQEYQNVKLGLHKIVERTNSVSRSPVIPQEDVHGDDMISQLAASNQILQQLDQRIDTLVEQKDILTRQIQQQRELNSKSDAQKDAQIQDLTEELEETKRVQEVASKEAQESQNEVSVLIDQLDRARQDAALTEQQRGMGESKALQAERDARKAAEKEMLDEIGAKQQINTQLQADMDKMRNDFEVRSQQHIQQVNELTSAKDEKAWEVKGHQEEAEKLLEQMASLQTELTLVKAELDGAYGSRAQRAADVSLNPAIQKEMDLLIFKNAELQKELKDTIEDYEQMTKASIEFEKERDRFESLVDSLREKCEALELQLGEEKLKWLGFKSQAPTETTSATMLKNEFKKMMRDTRIENSKALKTEQDERRRLEALIRSMRKEAGLATPAKSTISSHLSADPSTPSRSRK